MLTEYDGSNNLQRKFIYGNYIDEVLLMKAGENDYYYAHDHLYSPAALIDSSGTVLERYEYDAYGNCSILEPNFAPDPDGKSDYGNPYLFTGRRLDILDDSSLKIQYNRNRYYDYYTGRWLTHDPLGINRAGKIRNLFSARRQYEDGLNLYEYTKSNPVMFTDIFGLTSSTCGPFCDCDPHLFDEEKIKCVNPGSWSPAHAALWFLIGRGQPVIFCPRCRFTRRLANNSWFVNHTLRQTFETLEEKAASRAAKMKPNSCKAVQIVGWGAYYQFGSDWFLENTIGSGGGGPNYWSQFIFDARCCLKKPCCDTGHVDVNIRCKVKFRLADLYDIIDFDWGTPFWTIVYFYKDFGPKNISVPCK